MKKRLMLLIISLALLPKVSALTCDNDVKVNYQEKAKNITYSYDYNDSNNTFNIIFTNISENFYFIDVKTYDEYGYTGNEKVFNNMKPGERYKFGIYTKNYDCLNENLYTLYVTLPYYNPYYNDSLCEGIENYKYCKKFINMQLTYEEFRKNVINYKNKLIGNNSSEYSDNLNTLFKNILKFYTSYYYIILPAIILSGIIIVWRYNKKQDLF